MIRGIKFAGIPVRVQDRAGTFWNGSIASDDVEASFAAMTAKVVRFKAPPANLPRPSHTGPTRPSHPAGGWGPYPPKYAARTLSFAASFAASSSSTTLPVSST